MVIVSHSQGTVITADLMHYLRARSLALNEPNVLNTPRQAAASARELGGWLGEDRVKLLTMGSPLRQLYAARFPVPYRWMLSKVDKTADQQTSAASQLKHLMKIRVSDQARQALAPSYDGMPIRQGTTSADGCGLNYLNQ